jgi:hypothetical protein
MAPNKVHLANANPLIQCGINRGNIGWGLSFADFGEGGGGHGLDFLWQGMMGRKPGLSHPLQSGFAKWARHLEDGCYTA